MRSFRFLWFQCDLRLLSYNLIITDLWTWGEFNSCLRGSQSSSISSFRTLIGRTELKRFRSLFLWRSSRSSLNASMNRSSSALSNENLKPEKIEWVSTLILWVSRLPLGSIEFKYLQAFGFGMRIINLMCSSNSCSIDPIESSSIFIDLISISLLTASCFQQISNSVCDETTWRHRNSVNFLFHSKQTKCLPCLLRYSRMYREQKIPRE